MENGMDKEIHTANGVRKFTKKPVTISAIQWTGSNLRQVVTFMEKAPSTHSPSDLRAWWEYEDQVKRDGLKINTLEGQMSANIGDWIIKGIKGEHYPCKPDIFDATYDAT